MNETSHTLSIIIPAYNEGKTIAELLQRVLDADLGENIEKELIVVNDCSTDATEQIVKQFIAKHPDAPITYLKHEKNYGKGMAVRTGIKAVTGDFVVMQDADLELDPNDFAQMLPFLLSGEYRVVYGSRFPRRRKFAHLFQLPVGRQVPVGNDQHFIPSAHHRRAYLLQNVFGRVAQIDPTRLRGV